MAADAKRVQTVFLAAIEAESPAELIALLDRECASDAELRARVEALLRAHDHPASILDQPAVPCVMAPPPGSTLLNVGDLAVAPETPGSAMGLGDDGDGSSGLDFLQPGGRPGSLGLLGHYEVLEVLGRGGFAIVVRAFDLVLQRVVAIKVLTAQMATTSSARKRFLREARAAAAVRNDHVVHIYAVAEQPRPYLVMDYIPGQTLQQQLDASGPLETTEMLRLAVQIARGLAAAHAQGLIHRDIKPSNILLEEGVETKVKLTDFGLARTVDDANLTQSGAIAGTPLYMAPEQARGDPIDHRADLFSLGSVFYVMLTGRPPFRAPSTLAVLKRVREDTPRPIRDIIPEAPPRLCKLIRKLHAKKPKDRFQTAQEVADLLVQLSAGTPTRGPSSAPRPWRWKWKWFFAAGLLLALGLTLGLTDTPPTTRVATLLGLKSGASGAEVRVERPPLPPTEPGQPGATAPILKKSLAGHTQAVVRVAYSPDGQLLASGDMNGEVWVWNMPDGTLHHVMPGRGPGLQALTFSPDGKSLLTISYPQGSGNINIWDAKTGKPDGVLKGHNTALFGASFGPDGNTLFSGGAHDGTIRSWDFAARRANPVRTTPIGARRLSWVVASAEGKIAVGGLGKTILLRAEGQTIKEFHFELGTLCFSPDGRLLAGATRKEGQVMVWDVHRGEEVGAWRSWRAHKGTANGVAFSRDGRILATAGSDGVARLWDVETQRQLAEVPHEGGVSQLAFAPDGVTLATTGMNDRLVKLWDVSFLRALKAAGKGN